MPVLTCPECSNQFEPGKAWQKYCSRDCNQSAYLKRKLEKKRNNPLAILDMDLSLGPSPAQEAEWQRRSEIAEAESAKKAEVPNFDLEDNRPPHLNIDVRMGIEERSKAGRSILDGKFAPTKEDK